MTARATVSRLIAGLTEALARVARAITSPEGFEEVATELGWELAELPPPLTRIEAPGRALLAAADAIAAEEMPSPAVLDGAALAIRDLVAALRALERETWPAGLEELRHFGREALDHSVLAYLFREHRLAYHALRVLGVVRIRYVEGAGPRAGRMHREILWANLGRVLAAPGDAYREAYGWGTRDFDGDAVLAAIQDLLCTMRWPAGLESLAPPVVDALAARAPDEIQREDVAVTIRFLSRVELGAEQAAGLRIIALPATAARLPALAVVPFAHGGVARRFAIDDHVDAELAADFDLQGGVALRLSPEDGLSLVGGLDAGTGTALHGRAHAAIDVHDPDKQPKSLLSIGASTLEATTLVGRAGAIIDGSGDQDLFVELELPDARLAVATADGDGFVRAVAPSDVASGLAIAVGVSTRRGVYLRGGAGLAARIPIDRAIGPVRLIAAGVTLAPEGGGAALRITTELGARIGPAAFVVEGLGFAARARLADGGNLGFADVAVDALAPTGLGVAIESELARGGGFLRRDPARGTYEGGLAIRIGPVDVTGLALLETRPQGGAPFSFACLLSATFPGIALPFGFFLEGVGGALLLHRTVDDAALRAGLRHGAVADLLFPDPAAIASAVARLSTAFPPRAHRHVVGPAARITWCRPRMVQADLAVLLELPAPMRVVVLGAIELGLPTLAHRIVDLRLDVLGVLDLARRTLAVDASLHDSTLAGYELTGDMALRLGWGAEPHLLFSVGGFHPRFRPPAGFPALRRLALTIGDNPRLRLEAYLALTSNTAQLGAHVDLHYKVAGLKIAGHLHFDALIELQPLHFEIDLAAGVALSYRGVNLASVRLAFLLTGPRPWHATGTATIGILWWDVTVGFDVTWGDRTPPPLPPAPDLAALLRAALHAPEAWAGELPAGERAWIALRDSAGAGGVRVHPLAELVVRQRVLPLDHAITRYAARPLGGAVRFRILSAVVGGTSHPVPPVEDHFAPGQYTQLRRDQQLAAPSFERMQSGVRIAAPPVLGPQARVTMEPDTVVDDPLAPPRPRPVMTSTPAALLAVVAAQRPTADAGTARPPRRRIVVRPPSFALASNDRLDITVAGAALAAGRTTYAALREAVREARAAGARPALQIVPRAVTSHPRGRVVVVREVDELNTDFVDTMTGAEMTTAQFVAAIRAGQYPDYEVRKIHGRDTPMSKPNASIDDNLG
jgi:hypothetical protein